MAITPEHATNPRLPLNTLDSRRYSATNPARGENILHGIDIYGWDHLPQEASASERASHELFFTGALHTQLTPPRPNIA